MTTQQALDWINGGWQQSPFAKTLNGKLGIDQDGLYGFQCKDFVNAYAIYLGAPFTAGNAITLWTQDQPGWERVTSPQAGDVFVKDYVGPDGINYGHTGAVKAVAGSTIVSEDQNWFNSSLTVGSPPAEVTHPISSLKGFLRRQGLTMQDPAVIGKAFYQTVFHRLPENDAAAVGAGEALLKDFEGFCTQTRTSDEWKKIDAAMSAPADNATPLQPGLYKVN